jgi:nucleotide-binding universal stress UspA family protein
MAIKTILVPLDESDSSFVALDTATIVGQRFGAHISAVHVMQRASDSAAFMFDRLSAKLREAVAKESEDDARERAADIRSRFEEVCRHKKVSLTDTPQTDGGATAAWSEEFGHVEEVLIGRARLHDVVVIAKPSDSSEAVRRSPIGETLEAIMLGAGRPVLIVPPAWQARLIERMAIGWNQSLESSRALAMSMPWLEQMAEVTVLASRKREQSAAELVEYLAWHGVPAKIQLLDGLSKSVGGSILKACAQANAEALVVGGFSHARARQLLFGGVTRHLLAKAELLTFMVH